MSRRSLQFSRQRSSSRFVSRSRIAIMIHDSSLSSRSNESKSRSRRAIRIYLRFREHQRRRDLEPLRSAEVLVLPELLLQFEKLLGRERRAGPSGLAEQRVLRRATCNGKRNLQHPFGKFAVDNGDSARMPRGWSNYPLALRNYDRESAKLPSLSHDSLSLHSLRISNR